MENTNIDGAWAAYVAAETDRIREVSMARLNELIQELQSIPEAERQAWARQLAQQHEDGVLMVPVRIPLFREVLFPALLSGMKSGAPHCARQLAELSQLLYKSPGCQDQLQANEQTKIGLLRAALRIDRQDERARGSLIKALRWQLEYSLHEIPAGVLYGHDGATLEQCEELQGGLLEFDHLVAAHGSQAEHADLVAQCRFHFKAYSLYLGRSKEFSSYAEYLAQADTA